MSAFSAVITTVLALLTGFLTQVVSADTTLYAVSGSVTTERGVIADGAVYFYSSCQDFAAGTPVAGRSVDGGLYTADLPAGSYRVRIRPHNDPAAMESWHNASPTCELATPVEVTGDSVINLTATALYAVSGSVSSAKGPISQGFVSFYASCQDFAAGKRTDSGVLAFGAYAVSLPPGAYRVRISPPENIADQASWHDASMTCEQATPVVVKGDSLINLKAVAFYTVTGAVRSASGPVASAKVEVFTDCQAYANNAETDGGWFNGTYSVTLPPGTYLFYAKVSSLPALNSWHGPAMTCEKATPVTVTGDMALDLRVFEHQWIKRSPRSLELGKRQGLAKRTQQDVRVTWQSRTPKVCKVTKYTLTGRRLGRCRLMAKAAETSNYAPYSELFRVRIYKR